MPVEDPDPVDLLFGGMAKLGPGSDADTLHVLRSLPRSRFDVVVDAGCGAGRQTLVLAGELATTIHAVDSHPPFLDELTRRAKAAGLDSRVETHCMDMKDIPGVFPRIDLLWSEGSAYNLGFDSALATWAAALAPGAVLAVSELCWLRDEVPPAVRGFFEAGYPAMRSVPDNLAAIARAGYHVLSTHTLPRHAWTNDYYDVLEPRARELLGQAAPAVRDLAAETLREIEVFRKSQESYGYVFFVLQR